MNTAVKIHSSCPNHSSKTLAALIREEVYKKKPSLVYSDRDINSLVNSDGIDILTFLSDPFSVWGNFITSSKNNRNVIIAVIDPPLVNSDSEVDNDVEVKASRNEASAVNVENVRRESNAENVKEGNVKSEGNAKRVNEGNTKGIVIIDDSADEESAKDSKRSAEKKKKEKNVKKSRNLEKEDSDSGDSKAESLKQSKRKAKKKKNAKKKKKRTKDKKSNKKEEEVNMEESDSDSSNIMRKKRRKVTHTDETTASIGQRTKCDPDEPAKKAAIAGNVEISKKALFIVGLPSSSTQDEVRQYFSPCGEITRCEVYLTKNGKGTGTATLEFATKEGCELCMAKNGADFNGRRPYIRYVHDIFDVQIRKKPEGCTTVFVGGLSNYIDEDDLQQAFSRFGKIIKIRTIKKWKTLIDFVDSESADAAVQMGGLYIRGRPIRVDYDRGTVKTKDTPIGKKIKGCNDIVVKGLTSSVETSDLQHAFSRCGEIDKIRYTGPNRQYAIIRFINPQSANNAVTMANKNLGGITFKVDFYNDRLYDSDSSSSVPSSSVNDDDDASSSSAPSSSSDEDEYFIKGKVKVEVGGRRVIGGGSVMG